MNETLRKQMEETLKKHIEECVKHEGYFNYDDQPHSFRCGFTACSEIYEAKLQKIAAMCGNPDASEACRNILKELE